MMFFRQMGTPVWIGLSGLAICLLAVRFYSSSFAYETAWAARPTDLVVLLNVLAGVCFLGVMVGLLHRKNWPNEERTFWLMVVLGLGLRVMWFGSEPILEDDTYRYFWDGALLGAGLNPYMIAPIEAALNHSIFAPPPELAAISASAPVDRVAYPSITTIYPPLTQVVFYLHHSIAPWNLEVWRMILLCADLGTLSLLVTLLHKVNRSRWLVMVFWLNPLIISETMNAGHMDALLLPLLVAATLGLLNFRFQFAAISLGAAIGIKLWPIVLAPLFAIYWYRQANFLWRQILQFSITVALLSSLVLAPQLLSNLQSSAGLVAYSSEWQTNAFLFQWLEAFWLELDSANGSTMARLTSILLLGLITMAVLLNPKSDPIKNLLWVVAALFLLSPTGYPWYYLWLMPWLVIRPHWALLILTVTLPLYDLRFHDFFVTHPSWFDWLVVPLQFIPVFILLLLNTRPAAQPESLRYA